ncbi:MAG: MFS transporter [Bryobacteraceae bacterium]|jgi:MFS family permease
MTSKNTGWDTAYEWKAVTLLGLGFGLVGLDRWIIAPLFPFMMKDLALGYQELGNIAGVLGLSWGFFAIISGGFSDRIGHRKILIPALVLFSLLSGVSGFATGALSLIMIRALMGITEGSFCPTSFAATNEASAPSRRGFNLGLQQCGFALFGLGFAPIVATQLLRVVPSWRYVFIVAAVPGLILAIFLYAVLREPRHLTHEAATTEKHPYSRIFHNRNIMLAMLALFCAMCGVFVLSAMLPNYLVDYLKLSGEQMGFVMSGLGFGGFIGQFALPGLSDLLGRRAVAVTGFAGTAALIWALTQTGANPPLLFGLLFLISLGCLGLVALITGPIATESAPVGLVSSAVGMVVGAGEIFGGGVAPSVAGYIAQNHGIQNILNLALGGVACGILVCLFLKETAPRKIHQGGHSGAEKALAHQAKG